MKTLQPLSVRSLFLCLLCAAELCYGQGTLTVTFDGPPVIAPGTGRFVEQYYESSIWFRPLGVVGPGNGFIRIGASPALTGLPDNGTAYVQASAGDSLMFSFVDAASFGLVSVDLAEYSTVFAYPATVHFVGYRQDGTTVTTDLTTDGVIDGTGPLADFQTFYFGPQFSGLTRVEIPYSGWSLDNPVISVPEPGTGTLLLLGAGSLAMRSIRRKDAP